MLRWDVQVSRIDQPIPGRDPLRLEGPKLRQLVTAITQHHNDRAAGPTWPPLRIGDITAPSPDDPGSLSLVWLPGGEPPQLGTLGAVHAVGDAVLQVTDISTPVVITLADLLDQPAGSDAEFRTSTAVRLTRRIGNRDIDVLVPREELVMTSVLSDWASIAMTDASAPALPDGLARRLLNQVILAVHRGIRVQPVVVKRDSRTGAPFTRRAFSGSWRLRLLDGSPADQRWFAALMRLAELGGIGRDHTIGGGRVRVTVSATSRPPSVMARSRTEPSR